MELCAGGELFHLLEKHGRFSESEGRVLFRHLMQMVLYCHENGVVHRDLKPENILLATKSFSSPIKLADFGLATYIKPGTCFICFLCKYYSSKMRGFHLQIFGFV
jgi:serine/threonine protein kinase